MYKVLIVDDEPLILEGLRKIINWEEYGLEIAGQALNGEEALEMLRSNAIHVLLTDIRMPRMNGLDLIRRIKAEGLDTRSIVLSGYNDFNYIKDALQLGIENYLLKPVIIDELSSTLLNVVLKIDSNLSRQAQARKDMDVIRDNILSRWVSDSIESRELVERSSLLNIDLEEAEYCAGIVKIVDANFQADEIKADRPINLGIDVNSACREAACEIYPAAMVFYNIEGETVVVFAGNGLAAKSGEITTMFYKFIDSVQQNFHYDVFITVGCVVRGYEAVYQSYGQAKDLQGYRLILPVNSVVLSSEIEATTLKWSKNNDFEIRYEELKNLLSAHRKEDSASFIRSIFQRLKKTSWITPDYIRYIAIELLYQISGALSKLKFNQNSILDENKRLFIEVLKEQNIEQLSLGLVRIAEKAIDSLQEDKDHGNPVILRILKRIETDFADDLSIKKLSYEYKINAAYLGQLFKFETGEILTNYVNKIRVEKAKILITDTDMKIYEISDKVGYSNLHYFYKVFKKYAGMSPSDLKNQAM